MSKNALSDFFAKYKAAKLSPIIGRQRIVIIGLFFILTIFINPCLGKSFKESNQFSTFRSQGSSDALSSPINAAPRRVELPTFEPNKSITLPNEQTATLLKELSAEKPAQTAKRKTKLEKIQETVLEMWEDLKSVLDEVPFLHHPLHIVHLFHHPISELCEKFFHFIEKFFLHIFGVISVFALTAKKELKYYKSQTVNFLKSTLFFIGASFIKFGNKIQTWIRENKSLKTRS